MSYHYTKSGALDMRYSSSRAAVSSGSYGGGGSSSRSSSGSGGGGGGYSSSSSSNLHYTKDGSLDMRYSSSKAAVASPSPSSGGDNSYSTSSRGSGSANQLNYTKDGSLDMRFSSSKAAVAQSGSSGNYGSSSSTSDLHLKKDGTPDMRYKSSRGMTQLTDKFQHIGIKNVPSHIPLTKSGLPDMRTKAAKEWVGLEAQSRPGEIPAWIPRKKDGRPDTSKRVVAEFLHQQKTASGFGICPSPTLDDHLFRQKYYAEKMQDPCSGWENLVRAARSRRVEIPKTPTLLPESRTLREEMTRVLGSTSSGDNILSQIPNSIPMLNYQELATTFGEEIGKGSFGVVLKGKWQGRDVAVKRLHLNQLTKKETVSFVKELKIMTCLGKHPNLVSLYGYTITPPCFIMEFVKLGSLSYILHYCQDPAIEAEITCGTVKKRILLGIVDGMRQLHAAGVVHGDLKPANVLLDEEYTAKITDFGLSTLRGKSSSALVSVDDGENLVGGTGGYMAPELLDNSKPPEFSCDIYSFGMLLNEVIHEEEPYSGQFQNFQGRGPFAAPDYARKGNRPFMKSSLSVDLRNIIQRCWNSIPGNRPSFDKVYSELLVCDIPNSF